MRLPQVDGACSRMTVSSSAIHRLYTSSAIHRPSSSMACSCTCMWTSPWSSRRSGTKEITCRWIRQGLHHLFGAVTRSAGFAAERGRPCHCPVPNRQQPVRWVHTVPRCHCISTPPLPLPLSHLHAVIAVAVVASPRRHCRCRCRISTMTLPFHQRSLVSPPAAISDPQKKYLLKKNKAVHMFVHMIRSGAFVR